MWSAVRVMMMNNDANERAIIPCEGTVVGTFSMISISRIQVPSIWNLWGLLLAPEASKDSSYQNVLTPKGCHIPLLILQ